MIGTHRKERKGSGGEESMDTESTGKEAQRKTKIKMKGCDKGHGGKGTQS